jgi:omega-amidase
LEKAKISFRNPDINYGIAQSFTSSLLILQPMSSLTITLIQTNLHWEDKKANLIQLEEKILSIREKTEIVVLPEMFSTGFSMEARKLAEKMDGPTLTWMKRISAEKKIILTGSVIIEEGGLFYNRLVWMLPNGQFGSYDKRHLFAYAGENTCYTSGNKRLIASANGWKINLQICYDLRFPVWSRQSLSGGQPERAETEPEYDLLIYVANWPERRILAWKSLLTARAIENQCFTVGLNRVGNDGNGIYHSGDSLVIDPLGNLLYQKTHEEDVFSISLQKDRLEEVRAKFPFWKDGDHFLIDP